MFFHDLLIASICQRFGITISDLGIALIDILDAFKKLLSKGTCEEQIEDKPGSLQQVLETFTRFEINLTKIQSIPIIGKPYAYSFHFDLEWQSNTPWKMAIDAAKQKIAGFKNLGVYKRGNRSDIVK